MSDDDLLAILENEKDEASEFTWGWMAEQRKNSMRDYERLPYGNEEEGRSQYVTSDIQDTIEWIKPSLLDIFTATDNVVSFEPQNAEDVKGAEQATAACNYVFTRQNNGFMTLYTAFSDALLLKNCAVHWYWKETTETETIPFKQIGQNELIALSAQSEIDDVITEELIGPDGMPVTVYSGRSKKTARKGKTCIEAFEPETLLISRNHRSPLLQDSPYTCRLRRTTLSAVRDMGFDLDPEDFGDDLEADRSGDRILRDQLSKDGWSRDMESESKDPAMKEGYLYYEYVRVDHDGDGIAELRYILRTRTKILVNETCSHVPIATASPVLRSHRWDGYSIRDLVEDLQFLHTTILRQMLDNLYLTNNPRKRVLTDKNGKSMANIDDLLDSRVGGIVRMSDINAVTDEVTPFTAGSSFPMLEYVQGMRENRSGVTRYNQGLDSNTLNKTARGVNAIMNASQQRIELIARVFAECLVKPIFQGILKLLTEHQTDPLMFKLVNEFVSFAPLEWRDQYDMAINVGLGTGNKDQQLMHLQQIAMAQQAAVAGGGMGTLVTPKQLYNTQAKIVENAGFKNVADFWQDPGEGMPPPKEPQEPPEVTKAKIDAESRLQVEQIKAQSSAQIEQYKAQVGAQTELQIAQIRESARSDLEVAKLNAAPQTSVNFDATGALTGVKDSVEGTQQIIAQALEVQGQALAMLAQSMNQLAQAQMAPKQATLSNGKTVTIQPMVN